MCIPLQILYIDLRKSLLTEIILLVSKLNHLYVVYVILHNAGDYILCFDRPLYATTTCKGGRLSHNSHGWLWHNLPTNSVGLVKFEHFYKEDWKTFQWVGGIRTHALRNVSKRLSRLSSRTHASQWYGLLYHVVDVTFCYIYSIWFQN